MTLSNRDQIYIGDVTPRIQFVADGEQTKFDYHFVVFVPSDLEVYVDDDRLSSGYAVLGAGGTYGGTVIFDTPPPAGGVVTLCLALSLAAGRND